MHDYLFLIDPGHGSDTPGKRSPWWDDNTIHPVQLLEWEFTRDIARRIVKWAPCFGMRAVQLVIGDEDVSLRERVDGANMYTDPEYILRKEKEILLISIHANAGGGRGIEVFTSPGQTLADRAADIFYKQYGAVFPEVRQRTDFQDGDADKEANFYILKHTVMPAILTENFFMDNERECRDILMTETGRADIAQVHLAAMAEINRKGLEVN
ncbi:N-acetylmuramoyl-L-alanine amidase [Candidatus Pacearchaeota archaeon]|nr:N-acetylmuramoyl-L-alanine amidase [Candidatus Pacearchaeota archaeon]